MALALFFFSPLLFFSLRAMFCFVVQRARFGFVLVNVSSCDLFRKSIKVTKHERLRIIL